jgi:hypothetical protein
LSPLIILRPARLSALSVVVESIAGWKRFTYRCLRPLRTWLGRKLKVGHQTCRLQARIEVIEASFNPPPDPFAA